MSRSILHVDMDAFYASVEQLDNPDYMGKPVIVGADPKGGTGRGVVAACSYEARKFGVRSALPISRAWKLCPDGVYVRPRMERYVEVSQQVMTILRRFTDLVEPLSIDEAFLDITGSIALFGSPVQIARSVKQQLREETGLAASVGCGPNKFIAKIASDLSKPDGLLIIDESGVAEFLGDLPISRLWGVGPKTETRVREMGLHTIGQVRASSRDTLIRTLGSLGEHLYQLANGNDDRPVIPHWEPKSISSEHTFEEDTQSRPALVQTIHELAAHVGRRLRREDYRARRVTIKIRYENFETHTKQSSLARPIQTDEEIARVAISLFDQFPLDRKIRLIGVGAGELGRRSEQPRQLQLFDDEARPAERAETLDHTMDRIREKFGDLSVRRGSQLPNELE